MRLCSTKGCGRKHYARGLCKPEYRTKWLAGSFDQHPRTQIPQPVQADGRRICTIAGCGRDHYANGWCHGHDTRVRKHGDPMADVPLRRKSLRFGYYNTPAKPDRSRNRAVEGRGFDLIDTNEL